MTHTIHMVMDFQYGSTGKGLIAGYLGKREKYDVAVCAFATNAGHTYIDKERGIHVMTQQIPTNAVASESVKHVLLGPGSLIHIPTFLAEIEKYKHWIGDKKIMIHPQAALVNDYHAAQERVDRMSKIGSTGKGVGAAAIERVRRDPETNNTCGHYAKISAINGFSQYVCSESDYRTVLENATSVIVEGAQGYSLSMYHGQYPYTTSRDVTPWQLAADCGLPFKWAPYIQVIGTMRCFPIRVNNQDGSSGPHYSDQRELAWDHFKGVVPEKTTVTKLERRIFTFSEEQATEASWHCGSYLHTSIFLNFANYCVTSDELDGIIKKVEGHRKFCFNPPVVGWIGHGADDADVTKVKSATDLWGIKV